jgi:hypothetical protein
VSAGLPKGAGCDVAVQAQEGVPAEGRASPKQMTPVSQYVWAGLGNRRRERRAWDDDALARLCGTMVVQDNHGHQLSGLSILQ